METSQCRTVCPNCTLTPWKKQMMRLATDPKFHDVWFIVGTKTNAAKIGCNRSLLSIHCPVFDAMFGSNMLESSSHCVEIPDIKPIVFAAMLQWMTTDTLNILSICHLSDLINLADKYQIKGLLDSCSLFLKSNTITIHIVTDSILCKYHGVDLGLRNLKEMSIKLRILSYSSIHDIIMAISKQLNWNAKYIKIWRVSNRKNGTIRPNRYLSPNIDKANDDKNNNKKKEKDDDEEDDAYEDEDEVQPSHNHNHNHSNIDMDDEAMDLDQEHTNNLFDTNNMKCHLCYNFRKQKNTKMNKNIDWNQYSGDNPTKAIYARLCCTKIDKKEENDIDNEPSSSFVFGHAQNMKINTLPFMEIESKANAENDSPMENTKNYQNKILLFLKYYDVYHENLSMICSILVDKNGKISAICKAIREMAHWSEEHEILLFEEEDYNSNKINSINVNQTISDTSLVDGDIIVFQEKSNIFKHLQLNDVRAYFEQYSRCLKNNRNRNHNKANANNDTYHRAMNAQRSRRMVTNANNVGVLNTDVDDPFIL